MDSSRRGLSNGISPSTQAVIRRVLANRGAPNSDLNSLATNGTLLGVNVPANIQENFASPTSEHRAQIPIVDLCTPAPNRHVQRLQPRLQNSPPIITSAIASPDPSIPIIDLCTPRAPRIRSPGDSDVEEVPDLDESTIDLSTTLALEQVGTEVKCPICFNPVEGRNPMETRCGCIYCKECITAVFKHKIFKQCPMCKTFLPVDKPFI
jgi:hypothetical protein